MPDVRKAQSWSVHSAAATICCPPVFRHRLNFFWPDWSLSSIHQQHLFPMHFHFSPFDGQLGVLISWERKKSCSLEILLCAVEVTMTFCGTDMSFLPHIRPLTAVAVESRLWIKCHSGVKKKEVFEVVKRKKTLSCHRGKMPFWVRYVFVSWFFFFLLCLFFLVKVEGENETSLQTNRTL